MSQILIVEDDQPLSSAYQLILERAGYSVSVANNGKLGLAVAAQETPEIILLDLLMPVIDGIEFLRRYKLDEHAAPQIIVLSNMGDEKLVEQARTLGAYKYIVKAHTSPNQLVKLVSSVLAKRQAVE